MKSYVFPRITSYNVCYTKLLRCIAASVILSSCFTCVVIPTSVRSPSVIDCTAEPDAIERAIRRALDKEFASAIADQKPAYGAGDASRQIVDVV